MQARALLDALRTLEVALHQGQVRSDPEQLGALLHHEFREIGRSGVVWSRQATLAEFDRHPPQFTVWSQDFQVEELAPGVALLTYRSAHVAVDGALQRHTLRTSIWMSGDAGWTLRFHQGTPTEPFEQRV